MGDSANALPSREWLSTLKKDGKIWLYASDPLECPVGACCCGNIVEYDDLSEREVAVKFATHFKNKHSGSGAPSMTEIEKFFQNTSGKFGITSRLKCGLILPMHQPTAEALHSILLENKYFKTEKSICIECFRHDSCICSADRVTVTGLVRERQGFVSIVSHDQWKDIEKRRCIIAKLQLEAFERDGEGILESALRSKKRICLMNAGFLSPSTKQRFNDFQRRIQAEPGPGTAPPPPTPSAPHHASSSASSSTAGTSTTNPASSTSSPLPSPSGSPSSVDEGFAEQREELFKVYDVQHGDHHGCTIVVEENADPNANLSILPGPRRFQLKEDAAVRVKDTEKGTVDRASTVESELEQLLFGIASKELSEEKRRHYAHLSRDINTDSPTDAVLVDAVEMIVCNAVLNAPFSIVAKELQEAFLSPLNQANVRNGDSNHVLMSGGANMNLHPATRMEYVRNIAKCIRIIIEGNMAYAQVLKPIVQETVTLRNQLTEMGPEIYGSQSKKVAEVIFDVLLGILISPVLCIPLIFRPLLFTTRQKSKRRSRNTPQDEMDEVDFAEEEEAEETMEMNNEIGRVETRSPNSLRGYSSALIYAFKVTMILHVQGEKEYAAEQFHQGMKRIAMKDLCPIERLLSILKKHDIHNLRHLAVLSSQLRRLEDRAPASVKNHCQFTRTAQNILTINWKDQSFTGSRLQEITECLVDMTRREICQLLSGSDSTEHIDQETHDLITQVFEALKDPRRGSPFDLQQHNESSNNSCPTLNMQHDLIRKVAETAKGQFHLNPVEYEMRLNTFQQLVFCLVQWFLAGVLRPSDLAQLCLASNGSDSNGVVFVTETQFMSKTLMFMGVASKNTRDVVTFIPIFPSRVLMMFLQLFRPPLSKIAMREVDSLLQEYQVPISSQIRGKFENHLVEELTTCLGALPKVHDGLRRALEQNRTVTALEQFFEPGESALVRVKNQYVNECVQRVLIRDLMQCDMPIPVLRKLLVIFKDHIPEFAAEHLSKIQHPERLEAMKALDATCDQLKKQDLSVETFASTAGHSAATDRKAYQSQARFLLGGKEVATSSMKYQEARLLEGYMAVFLGIPILRNLGSVTVVLDGSNPRAIKTMFLVNENSFQQRVMERINEFGKEDFLNQEQKKLSMDVYEKNEDVAVFLPCGWGKTFGTLLPFAVAPKGFLLIVVPLRALLHTMMHDINNGMQMKCEEFCNSDPRFNAEAFTNGIREADDNVRFVIAVYDTAVKPACMDFLRAASSRGLLNGVLIDECHQLITSSKYRPSMDHVPKGEGTAVEGSGV